MNTQAKLLKELVDIKDAFDKKGIERDQLKLLQNNLLGLYVSQNSFIQKQWGAAWNEHRTFINERRERIELTSPDLIIGKHTSMYVADIVWKVYNHTLTVATYTLYENEIKTKLDRGIWIPWTEKEWTLPTVINFSSVKMKEETSEKPFSARYYGATARGRILVFTTSFISAVKAKEKMATFYFKKNAKKTAYDLYSDGKVCARAEIERVYLSKEDFVADHV